jgi:hypothetical protein
MREGEDQIYSTLDWADSVPAFKVMYEQQCSDISATRKLGRLESGTNAFHHLES